MQGYIYFLINKENCIFFKTPFAALLYHEFMGTGHWSNFNLASLPAKSRGTTY